MFSRSWFLYAHLSLLSNWVSDEGPTPGTCVSMSVASACIRTLPLQDRSPRCLGRLLLLLLVLVLGSPLQVAGCCSRCDCW